MKWGEADDKCRDNGKCVRQTPHWSIWHCMCEHTVTNAHRDQGKNVHANKQMDNPMQMWACCFGTEEQ